MLSEIEPKSHFTSLRKILEELLCSELPQDLLLF